MGTIGFSVTNIGKKPATVMWFDHEQKVYIETTINPDDVHNLMEPGQYEVLSVLPHILLHALTVFPDGLEPAHSPMPIKLSGVDVKVEVKGKM